MTFLDFFQQNIILFIAATGVLAAILFLELRGFGSRGATLNTTQMTQRINAGSTLIDLRKKADFDAGHIAGAKNIPFDTFDDHIDNIGATDKAVTLYCYKGVSSGKALTKLKKHGYTDLAHLQGGMENWARESLPTVKS